MRRKKVPSCDCGCKTSCFTATRMCRQRSCPLCAAAVDSAIIHGDGFAQHGASQQHDFILLQILRKWTTAKRQKRDAAQAKRAPLLRKRTGDPKAQPRSGLLRPVEKCAFLHKR